MKFWKRVERRARQERHYRPGHSKVQLGYFLLDTCAVFYETVRDYIASKKRRG